MEPEIVSGIAANIGLIKPKYKIEDDGKVDPLGEFAIGTAANEVVSYCNLDNYFEIDPFLYGTIALMAVDYLDSSAAGMTDEDIEADSVKSVKQGDVTVTRESLSQRMKTIATTPGVLNDYRGTLNKFRRFRR